MTIVKCNNNNAKKLRLAVQKTQEKQAACILLGCHYDWRGRLIKGNESWFSKLMRKIM